MNVVELVEFVEARLTEDERSASYAANPIEDGYDEGQYGPSPFRGRRAEWTEIWSGGLDTGDDIVTIGDSTITRFVEDFDPARILREIAMKRAIIEKLREGDLRKFSGLLESVKLLASSYLDHPDYQKEWAL